MIETRKREMLPSEQKTIETITEFVIVLLVIITDLYKLIVLVLMETLMVPVGLLKKY